MRFKIFNIFIYTKLCLVQAYIKTYKYLYSLYCGYFLFCNSILIALTNLCLKKVRKMISFYLYLLLLILFLTKFYTLPLNSYSFTYKNVFKEYEVKRYCIDLKT